MVTFVTIPKFSAQQSGPAEEVVTQPGPAPPPVGGDPLIEPSHVLK